MRLWPLTFKDANSKLLDVVSVADVHAEEHVNILKLRFEPEFLLKFGQCFEVCFSSRL